MTVTESSMRQPQGWKPTARKSNFRVEVEYDYQNFRRPMSERDASGLLDRVLQLKDVTGRVAWDVTYICPNCKTEALEIRLLVGCCEANEREEGMEK